MRIAYQVNTVACSDLCFFAEASNAFSQKTDHIYATVYGVLVYGKRCDQGPKRSRDATPAVLYCNLRLEMELVCAVA